VVARGAKSGDFPTTTSRERGGARGCRAARRADDDLGLGKADAGGRSRAPATQVADVLLSGLKRAARDRRTPAEAGDRTMRAEACVPRRRDPARFALAANRRFAGGRAVAAAAGIGRILPTLLRSRRAGAGRAPFLAGLAALRSRSACWSAGRSDGRRPRCDRRAEGRARARMALARRRRSGSHGWACDSSSSRWSRPPGSILGGRRTRPGRVAPRAARGGRELCGPPPMPRAPGRAAGARDLAVSPGAEPDAVGEGAGGARRWTSPPELFISDDPPLHREGRADPGARLTPMRIVVGEARVTASIR